MYINETMTPFFKFTEYPIPTLDTIGFYYNNTIKPRHLPVRISVIPPSLVSVEVQYEAGVLLYSIT